MPQNGTTGLPGRPFGFILRAMLNILSGLIGLFALILMIPTIIPFLGWANWFILPIALFGVLVGWLSSSNGGRNFCLIVTALGALRLFIGGGII